MHECTYYETILTVIGESKNDHSKNMPALAERYEQRPLYITKFNKTKATVR